MAFRKRNVNLGPNRSVAQEPTVAETRIAGTRPSPLTSEAVTSTGTPSLDTILGGHGGLAMGSSLFVGENGTTDYAGALLKFYAAEGLCQGHHLHVIGADESWVRSLPGIADERRQSVRSSDDKAAADAEKMRIAWRYQGLGSTADRERQVPIRLTSDSSGVPYSHIFDLTKTLVFEQSARISCVPIKNRDRPFDAVLNHLIQALKSSPNIGHRVAIPTVLSPALWPASAARPDNFLRFLASLRALLRRHANSLTVMMTVPLELYPRTCATIRWAETLSDGVLELTPFPHLADSSYAPSSDGKGTRQNEERPQGMLHVHKLPITTERGEGGAGVGNSIGDDLAFTVSRKKFNIQPFSLPPVEGDTEAQHEAGKITAKDVEF